MSNSLELFLALGTVIVLFLSIILTPRKRKMHYGANFPAQLEELEGK